jgi:DNA ligase (NAD+)
LDFASDGVVLKVNNRSLQRLLGETQRSPRWAFAYKFVPERVETRLERIVLQVGRTGVVTPVAKLSPVWIAGTEVRRATLHNASEIERKDIREGDIVILEKAGEVIPAIIGVVVNKRSTTSLPFDFPKKCPRCDALLLQASGEIAWKCPNDVCPAKVECRVLHFVSRAAMHIEGMGDHLTRQLCQRGYLKDVADIYYLSHEQLMACEKIGHKTALRVWDHIVRSKQQPFWRLLHGLGVPGIGEKVAKDLAKSFPNMRALMAASTEILVAIPGVGEKTASDCAAYFQFSSTRQLIDRLEASGVHHIGENL